MTQQSRVEELANEKYPSTFESNGIRFDDTNCQIKREAFKAGYAAATPEPKKVICKSCDGDGFKTNGLHTSDKSYRDWDCEDCNGTGQAAATPSAPESCGVRELLEFIEVTKIRQTLKNGCDIETVHIPSLLHKANELLSAPSPSIPINAFHAECPKCGEKIDVIPPANTVIKSSGIEAGLREALEEIIKETKLGIVYTSGKYIRSIAEKALENYSKKFQPTSASTNQIKNNE